MVKALRARLHQGYKTNSFPQKDPVLPERYPGCPSVAPERCNACGRCIDACPVEALTIRDHQPLLDLSRCIFCGRCADLCETGAIRFTGSFRMGATDREGLLVRGEPRVAIDMLEKRMRRIFGHSISFRVVSAGGCGACEADINVLDTIGFDLGRFGIRYAASPRHADGLLITGPVTKNMREPLLKTYEAVPSPKIVVAVGTCAVSGGIYRGLPSSCDGADSVLPVDLYIPGCPPHPMTILYCLLAYLGRCTI